MAIDRNLLRIDAGVDLWIKRAESTFVDGYRRLVWQIFLRILLKTPQSSGKAVANWNIGVGAPDFSFSDDYGDAPLEHQIGIYQGGPNMGQPMVQLTPQHKRGDVKWRKVAVARNKPKLPLIQRRTKVFFSNGTLGDGWPQDGEEDSEGWNGGGFAYLEALQDPEVWVERLRDVNKPYETAQESLFFVKDLKGRTQGWKLKSVGGANVHEIVNDIDIDGNTFQRFA